VWVGLEVVSLPGLGVGVEDNVDTVALLLDELLAVVREIVPAMTYLGCDSHATRSELTGTAYPCAHEAELLLFNELDKILDLVLEVGIWLQVLSGVWIRRLVGWWVCVAERHFECGVGEVSGV